MSLAAASPSLLRNLGALRWASAAPLLRRSFAAVDASPDTHDDFKPKVHGGPSDVESLLKADVTGNQVFLYMKGVPDAPNCGFSDLACKVLRAYGVKFGSRNVLSDPAVRDGIKKFSNWPTIPQLYVGGEFVGGSDIMMSMHDSGDLGKLLDPIREAQEAAAKAKQG